MLTWSFDVNKNVVIPDLQHANEIVILKCWLHPATQYSMLYFDMQCVIRMRSE